MVTLEEISQLLYGAGKEVAGWQGTQDELIALAAKAFPGKAFCVVKQWILIDLTVNSDEKENSPGLVYFLRRFSLTKSSWIAKADSKLACGYAVISVCLSLKAACLKPRVPSTSSGSRY